MSLQSAIYVRCSKCAGASIKSALRSHSDCNYTFSKHHYTRYRLQVGKRERLLYTVLNGEVQYVQEHLGEIFESSWRFAVVRNPWDRAVSAYHYCQRYNEIPAGLSFKEALRIKFSDMSRFMLVHFEPQYDVLASREGCGYLNFLGRFENLQADFDHICRKLGIAQTTVPHRHKSKHKPYWDYYDREAGRIVKEKYAKDIEWLGYEFGK
jgi:hypothetical protein